MGVAFVYLKVVLEVVDDFERILLLKCRFNLKEK
jgi:hypothetical protein